MFGTVCVRSVGLTMRPVTENSSLPLSIGRRSGFCVTSMLSGTPPSLAARLGFGAATAVALTIEVTQKPERRPMESGNELFSVTGRINNPGETTQSVPNIRAQLLDTRSRVVYSWTIARPVARLAPGGSAEFDSAALDVPRAARALNLSFAGATAN